MTTARATESVPRRQTVGTRQLWPVQFLALATLLLAWAVPLHAQEPEAPADPAAQAEALRQQFQDDRPATLFDAKLGDATVELLAVGFWKSGIALGLAEGPISGVAGYESLPWVNEVELLLSLWYDSTWFLESQLGAKIEYTTFALGYAKPEAAGLRKLIVGNARIGSDTPVHGLDFGSPVDGIPGLAVAWGDGPDSFDALVRLQNAQQREEVFSGTKLAATAVFNARNYLRGLAFQLPHGDIGSLILWQEDSLGSLASDGKRYRRLDPANIHSLDPGTGMLVLSQPATGRLLAFYRSSGTVWSSLDGTIDFPDLAGDGYYDFSTPRRFVAASPNAIDIPNAAWYDRSPGSSITIEGLSALILHRPGETGVFEVPAWYPATSSSDDGEDSAASPGSLPCTILVQEGDGTIQRLSGSVTAAGILVGSLDTGSLQRRYPLRSLGDSVAAAIYSPAAAASPISLQVPNDQASAGTLTLQQNPLPESVQVYRNGVLDPSFSYDPATATLSSPQPILGDDEIRVRYLVADRLGSQRLLQGLFAWNHVPGENQAFQLALGASFALPEQEWTALDSPNPGMVRQSARWTFKDPLQNLTLAQTLGVGFPDLKGLARIAGFDDSRLTLGIAAANLLPAPGTNLLVPAQRGAQPYRDFRTSDSLLPWTSSAAPATRPWADGEAVGPSVALADPADPVSGTVLYLPFAIEQALGESWAGAALRLDASQRQAARQATELRFYARGLALSGGTTLRVVLGVPAEDLDGDGAMDRASPGSKGMAFEHRGMELQALVQAPQSVREAGEDRNGNKMLDPSRLQWQWESSPETLNTSFSEFRIPLTAQARSILQESECLQFIVEPLVAGDLSGTLIVGGIALDGAGRKLQVNAGTVTMRELVDSAASTSLASAFPQTGTTGAGNSSNAMVELANTGLVDSTFTFSQDLGDVQAGAYRNLLLHVKVSANSTLDSLRLIDGSGNVTGTSSASLSLNTGTWHQIRIGRRAGLLELLAPDGSVVASQSWSGDSKTAFRSLELTFTTPSASTILVDEFLASDADARINASLDLAWQLKSPSLWREGDVDLVGPLDVQIKSGVMVDTTSDASQASDSRASIDAGLGTSLFLVDLKAGISWNHDSARDQLRGYHSLAFPAAGLAPIQLGDSFALGPDASGAPALRHGLQVDLKLPGVLEVQGKGDLEAGSQRLRRDWAASLRLPLSSTFSTGLAMNISEQGMGYPALPAAYFDAWTRSFGDFLSFDEGSKHYRTLQARYNLESKSPGLLLRLGAEAASRRGSFGTHDSEHLLSGFFSLGLGQQENDWYLGLESSSQMLSQDWRGLDSPAWDEAKTWLDDVGTNPAWWFPWPVWSVLDPAWPGSTLPKGTLKAQPAAGLVLARPRSADAWDFFLPRTLELRLQRLWQHDAATSSDQLKVEAALGFLAINLFGTSGTQALSEAWSTDAYNGRIELASSGEGQSVWTLGWRQSSQLFGLGDPVAWELWKTAPGSVKNLLVISDPFSLNVDSLIFGTFGSDTGTEIALSLVQTWLNSLDETADIRTREAKSKGGRIFLYHRETLGLGYREGGLHAEKGKGSDNLPPAEGFRIHLAHESILFWPDFGYLSLSAGVGYLHQSGSMASDSVAARLGAEIKIVF